MPYGAPRKKKHTRAKLSPGVFLIHVKLLAALLRLRCYGTRGNIVPWKETLPLPFKLLT